MKYMVIMKDQTVFMANWFSFEKSWTDNVFCVINKHADKVTFDGKTWKEASYETHSDKWVDHQ